MKLLSLFLALVSSVAAAANNSGKTVVDLLAESPQYKMFSTALHTAGLKEEFSGEGPFTIFAPTDEALAKLPAGEWDSLLKPENKAKLVSCVTHHIVPSKVVTDSLKTGPITTLNGRDVTLSRADDGKIKVGNAVCVGGAVVASNGIIHGIDTLIEP